MIRIILVLAVLSFHTLAVGNDCVPFGTRTFFGRAYIDPTNPEILQLKFNTKSTCPSSFVKINQGLLSTTVGCTEQKLEITNATTFTTIVHTCLLSGNKFGTDITYSVYGVDPETGESHLYKNKEFTIRMVDPRENVLNRFVMFADWGPTKQQPYIPILETLKNLVANNRTDIHGVMIQGDIAYDLDSNECKNYLEFLEMVEEIATVWPVLLTPGNHEQLRQNTWKLFAGSFEVYDMATPKKIQTYHFKWATFMSLDMFPQVFRNASQEVTLKYAQNIRQQCNRTKQEKKPWAIAASHYPFFCSSDVYNCTKNNQSLLSILTVLNDFEYSLYLSGHTHSYEREYPIYKGAVSRVDGPYHNTNALVTIVEGVAGNKNDIVEGKYPLLDVTARATFNETGFGLMIVHNETHLEYEHYSTLKEGMQLKDQVLITKFLDPEDIDSKVVNLPTSNQGNFLLKRPAEDESAS